MEIKIPGIDAFVVGSRVIPKKHFGKTTITITDTGSGIQCNAHLRSGQSVGIHSMRTLKLINDIGDLVKAAERELYPVAIPPPTEAADA